MQKKKIDFENLAIFIYALNLLQSINHLKYNLEKKFNEKYERKVPLDFPIVNNGEIFLKGKWHNISIKKLKELENDFKKLQKLEKLYKTKNLSGLNRAAVSKFKKSKRIA